MSLISTLLLEENFNYFGYLNLNECLQFYLNTERILVLLGLMKHIFRKLKLWKLFIDNHSLPLQFHLGARNSTLGDRFGNTVLMVKTEQFCSAEKCFSVFHKNRLKMLSANKHKILLEVFYYKIQTLTLIFLRSLKEKFMRELKMEKAKSTQVTGSVHAQ